MKFAVALLLATTSAIRIEKGGSAATNCVDRGSAMVAFNGIDKKNGGTGELKGELVFHALGWFLGQAKIQGLDWKWIGGNVWPQIRGNGGALNADQFWEAASEVAEHFGKCVEHSQPAAAGGSANAAGDSGDSGQCVPHDVVQSAFNQIAGTTGHLEGDQFFKAMGGLLGRAGIKTERSNWEYMGKNVWPIIRQNKNQLSIEQFDEAVNSVSDHFGWCSHFDDSGDSGDSGDSSDKVGTMQGCLPQAESDKAFHYIDTDKNGSLSYSELGAGLNMLFKSKGIQPTQADWEWIKTTGSAIDSKNPGVIDEGEFNTFANAVLTHFGVMEGCASAEGNNSATAASF